MNMDQQTHYLHGLGGGGLVVVVAFFFFPFHSVNQVRFLVFLFKQQS